MKKRPAEGQPGGEGGSLVRVSKEVSRILRHAPPAGQIDAAGWVPVPALLKAMRVKTTEEVLRRVVHENDKKRFVLDDSVQPPRIRAAQGHTVELEQPVLEPVTDASSVPVAVHVTGSEGWAAIQTSGELRRMKRTHIHFATDPGHMRKNSWASVYLRLNLKEALAAGHEFGLSSNGVLLTPGPLPTQFVTECTLAELPEAWAAAVAAAPERAPREGRGKGKQQQRADAPAPAEERAAPAPEAPDAGQADQQPSGGE